MLHKGKNYTLFIKSLTIVCYVFIKQLYPCIIQFFYSANPPMFLCTLHIRTIKFSTHSLLKVTILNYYSTIFLLIN